MWAGADAQGATRALQQADLLIERLLGIEAAPKEFRDQGGKTSERLCELALIAIARRDRDQDIDSDRVAHRAVLRSWWLLGSGFRYFALHARNRLRGSEERRQIALPRGLHWLYWFMRPFMWAGRRLQRR